MGPFLWATAASVLGAVLAVFPLDSNAPIAARAVMAVAFAGLGALAVITLRRERAKGEQREAERTATA